MTAAAARLGSALRVGPRTAAALIAVGIVSLPLLVIAATRVGLLPMMAIGIVAGAAAILALRWPLVGLLAFAALIPIEEVTLVGGTATLSRIAGLAFAATYALPRLASLRLGVIRPAGWAFAGWAVLSTAWAISPATAWTELPTLLQLFTIAVLVGDFVTREPSIVRPVLLAYSLSAAVTAAIGVISYVTGLGVDVRAAAIAGQNPAQFAAVLLPAFAFGFNEVVSGRQRMMGGAIAMLTLLGVLVSGTRGAWVAIAVIPLFVLPNLSPRRIAAVLALGAALLVVAYQVPGVSDLVTERADTAVSSGGAGRTSIWSSGLVIYASSPALGVGYANFPIAYTPEVMREAGVTSYLHTGLGPHNIVVGTLAELGPVGLVLLCLFLLPLVINRGWGPDAATLRASIASLLTIALFLDVVGNRKQVWLMIGLAAGLQYLARREAASRETSRPAAIAMGRRTVARARRWSRNPPAGSPTRVSAPGRHGR
jgi:O-antigen ligase